MNKTLQSFAQCKAKWIFTDVFICSVLSPAWSVPTVFLEEKRGDERFTGRDKLILCRCSDWLRLRPAVGMKWQLNRKIVATVKLV